MRTLTANASAKLSQNIGTEWLVILEVEWVDNGSVYYSDQDFDGVQANILQMDGFDTSMILEGSSDSQELGIVLSDTDNAIKNIYNTVDIHKRPVRVYMVEKSLSLSDKILVFRGELVTPVEWAENQRSVSFNVLSKLQERQVGFSMEEGDFPNIPDEALGKAWPLAFGQVCHLPAVKVRAPRRGYLQGGVGIHDFTLDPRICQALKIKCPSQSTGSQQQLEQGANNEWNSLIVKTIGPDLECVNRRFGEICRLRDLLAQQVAYEYETLDIYNGTAFPQSEDVSIFIDNAIFRGWFSGNIFTVNSRTHPEYDTFEHQACRAVPKLAYGTVQWVAQWGGTGCTTSGGYWKVTHGGSPGTGLQAATWIPNDNGTAFSANQNQAQAFQSCDEALVGTPGMVGGPKDSWAFYDEMEASSFFWAPAGSEVYMESESEILYIVSLLPGTVDGVAAYRTAPNGFRYLTEVPSDYYTVYETDYDGYQVVEIGMDKALPLYDDQWEDQIYVSFTSSVGPNPCDIIEWLLGKYTGLTADATTFAEVAALLTNYPTNFYITARPDVYDLVQDIAYQSRCAVYVRNDVMYIKYLPKEPTSVRTISESDVLSGSFQETITETEDVYTTHKIAWQKGGATVRSDQDLEHELVLKYNVSKYGTVEEAWKYYCHNTYDMVLKTGTFWLIRKSTAWKRVSFQVPFKHLDLDVGDCITLNVERFGGAVKAVIEKMTFDPDNYTVAIAAWTPVRAGETSSYYWAWPSQQACVSIWPLAGDPNGGGGNSFTVIPPIGHILLGGAHRDDQRIITSGELHPSDLCDTSPPDVVCEISDYWDFDEIEPEIIAKQIAQSAARQAMENNMSGGGNGGGDSDSKEEISECGDGGGGCNYKVDVQWHTSEAQGQATVAGGPSDPEGGGPCGGPCHCEGGCPSCYGPIWTVCHTFGSAWAAQRYASYAGGASGKSIGAYWRCSETSALRALASNGTHSGPAPENCEDIGFATEDGQVNNETAAPI